MYKSYISKPKSRQVIKPVIIIPNNVSNYLNTRIKINNEMSNKNK